MPSRRTAAGLAAAAGLTAAAVLAAVALTRPPAAAAPARVDWTTSRVAGTPDPAPPYVAERAFPKLQFRDPVLMERGPGGKRFFVGEQHGKVWSFPDDPAVARADLAVDLAAEVDLSSHPKAARVGDLYGLAFHPKFPAVPYCYACYTLVSKTHGENLPDGTRLSRFRMSTSDPPRIDPKSETVLLTWIAGGHNGGCLQFGPDGMLYVTSGDGTSPNPPDGYDTGQGVDDLLSCVLRIDVDRADAGKAYGVPKDNPFAGVKDARPEVWAFGFRNPWKMSFDRLTGELWVGDVGWEQWELVHRVVKGGNYGWAAFEGPQPVKPAGRRGPGPVLPAAYAFPHTEAASITGGYVYRGKRLADIAGAYVCGDWATRRLWAIKFDGPKVAWQKEIAAGNEKVIGFCEDAAGELYFLHHDATGTVHRLVPNPAAAGGGHAKFPRKLSETGLFARTAAHRPAAGVVPFAVNAEMWADGATAERFAALPPGTTAAMHEHPKQFGDTMFSGRLHFPAGAVLAKTISLAGRRVETQMLHFDGVGVRGYTYAWDDAQADAELVDAAGGERRVGGRAWRFHSRSECLQCHNPWAGYALAFTPGQLDRGRQLSTLKQMKLVAGSGVDRALAAAGGPWPGKLAGPHDDSCPAERRARSYLHVNCSHCHQFGAGGSVDIDLRVDASIDGMKVVGVRPRQGDFGLADARIVAAGDPYRSALFYRVSKLGRGRMPHVGSEVVDDRGVALLAEWARQLPPHAAEQALVGRLGSAKKAAERKEALDRLLGTTAGALVLACGVDRLPPVARAEAVAAGLARPEPQVRELFERFAEAGRRPKRLGPSPDVKALLAAAGDADRGRGVFHGAASQCASCHKVAGVGGDVGPDLTRVGAKLDKPRLLESLLEPSKVIDPPFATHAVQTADGRVLTGLVAGRTATELTLRDAQGKTTVVPLADVERDEPQKQSLMPEGLVRDLTADEAADLLAYLASLR